MRASTYGRQSSNKAKSIAEQLEAGHAVIGEQGWDDAGDYQDGRSASRFGTKPRGGWAQVLTDVKAAGLDVLILWESSRGDRTLSSWSTFLEDCRNNGVRIYVITHERLYDLKNARDWKSLAEDGVSNAYESEILSVRTKRGHAGAAKAGLPPGGPTPLGYKRTFDPNTGKRLGQEPHEPEATLVREVFEELAEGRPVLHVAASKGLAPDAVRRIARNRAYVGLRVHNGIEHKGTWKPLVKLGTFNAANRFLSDPSRKTTRPGRQTHLLSYLAKCGVCDGWINFSNQAYRCRPKGCVSIPDAEAEQVVMEIVVARLSRPDGLAALKQDDEHEAARAQAEFERLEGELKQWRMSAAKGKTSPESLAVIEEELTNAMKEQQEKIRNASLPDVLRGFLDPTKTVQESWNAATLTARRLVLKSLCEIRVGKGIPGRASAIQKRERAFHRLGPSRWIGDTLTWAQHLGAGQN